MIDLDYGSSHQLEGKNGVLIKNISVIHAFHIGKNHWLAILGSSKKMSMCHAYY